MVATVPSQKSSWSMLDADTVKGSGIIRVHSATCRLWSIGPKQVQKRSDCMCGLAVQKEGELTHVYRALVRAQVNSDYIRKTLCLLFVLFCAFFYFFAKKSNK
jgi:hypothetical protein